MQGEGWEMEERDGDMSFMIWLKICVSSLFSRATPHFPAIYPHHVLYSVL